MRKTFFFTILSLIVAGISLCDGVRAQTWQFIAPMSHARVWHQAQFLNNGKILVMGGENGSQVLNSCELYDPSTNTWSAAASMNIVRTRFQSLLLSDGRVFVAGGLTDLGNSTTNTCEIYDPSTNTWKLTASMNDPREEFGLCEIPGNKIALIGGLNGNCSCVIASADLYDVATGTMTALPSQLQITAAVAAVYSPKSNAIYVAGGNQGGYGSWKLQTTQKFSLNTWKWSYVDSMIDRQAAQFNTLIRPSTGEVYLFTNDTGYYYLKLTTLVESMNPSTEQWKSVGTITPRSDPRGIVFGDSAIFLGGVGASGNGISNCSWFNFSTGQFLEASPLLDSVMDGFVLSSPATTQSGCSSFKSIYILAGQTKPGNIIARCEVLNIGSEYSGSPSTLHRESGSAYFGQVDSLPLDVDLSSQINIDSLWPYVSEIQATYSWDSSVVTYDDYIPPAGWTLYSITNHRDALDIDIQNTSGSASNPLQLGTALFRPKNSEIGTSWVQLPNLTLIVSGKPVSLCVTDNEDNHWAVKTLGVPSGVGEVPIGNDEISVYPNPASNDLFIRNQNNTSVPVTLYDAIGRTVLHTSLDGNSTTTFSHFDLARGSYLLVSQIGEKIEIRKIDKIQ